MGGDAGHRRPSLPGALARALTTTDVTWPQAGHVVGIFALSVAVRWLLFPYVGIWGDAGFYVYDARLINQGLMPYVDFVGRSPLWNYLYAWLASYAGNTMAHLRLFIVVPWLLTGLPVYFIGRRLHGHAAGVVALAIMELSPFMLVYGYWANTQSLAMLCATTAIAVLVYRTDWRAYTVAGGLFGLAFLARRSVVAIMLGVVVWMAYRALLDTERTLVPALACRFRRGIALSAAFAATLFAMYGWVALQAGGGIGMTLALAETHAWRLVSSSGRGGFPLLTSAAPPPVQNQLETGRVPIFNDLCQMCGAWTARTFAKTSMVAIVPLGALLWYLRDWTDRVVGRGAARDYLLGLLLLLGLYAAATALQAGYVARVGAVLVYLGLGVLAVRMPALDADLLYGSRQLLVVLCCAGLMVGYLYRNRVLYTYYFLDFLPFLAVLAGVVYTTVWQQLGDRKTVTGGDADA